MSTVVLLFFHSLISLDSVVNSVVEIIINAEADTQIETVLQSLYLCLRFNILSSISKRIDFLLVNYISNILAISL